MTAPAETPPIVVQLIDEPMLTQCRQVIEAILRCLRAERYQRTVSPDLASRVGRLSHSTYQWHWLAWKMQGFRRGCRLGYTEDGCVYVETREKALIGDPKTDAITEIAVRLDGQAPHPTVDVSGYPPLGTLPEASDLIH